MYSFCALYIYTHRESCFLSIMSVKFRLIINVLCGYKLVMLTQVVFTHSNNPTQVATVSCLLFAWYSEMMFAFIQSNLL